MRLTGRVIKNSFGDDEFTFSKERNISISPTKKGNHMYPYTHRRWGLTLISFVQFRPSDRLDQKETFTFGPGQCITYTLIENVYGSHIHNSIVCDQKEADIKEPLHAESESDAKLWDDTTSYMYITYENALKRRLESSEGRARKPKKSSQKIEETNRRMEDSQKRKSCSKNEGTVATTRNSLIFVGKKV